MKSRDWTWAWQKATLHTEPYLPTWHLLLFEFYLKKRQRKYNFARFLSIHSKHLEIRIHKQKENWISRVCQNGKFKIITYKRKQNRFQTTEETRERILFSNLEECFKFFPIHPRKATITNISLWYECTQSHVSVCRGSRSIQSISVSLYITYKNLSYWT